MVSIIQLYKPTNTNYESNGDIVLMPLSAELSAELNGVWELTLTHPIDDEGRWKEIEEGAVIKVPSFMTEDQLYRITSTEKADSGITAVCEPVFMDARDEVFLTDVRPTKKNGQQALDIMLAGTKYSGKSDINKTSTAYYEYMNAIEALNGNNDNAFVNRWGGEILFDNFGVIVNERVGGDYGVQLLYGKNIPADGLTEQVEMSEVATRIYPKAYNGLKYNANNKAYIDSPIIGSYPKVYARTIQYEHIKLATDATEDDVKNPDIIICDTQAQLNSALADAINADYEAGLDKPKVTITADMVLLANTTLYENYAPLEEVGLGDTIHCKHNRLGIVTDARVIKLSYDSIRKKVTSVTLGDFEYNYFNNVSSAITGLSSLVGNAIRSDGSLIAEKVKGLIDGAYASLTAQYNVAQKQDVQAILFENLDTSSPMYGAVGIGTQGLQISKQRTADGKAWDWTTAITAGGIIADAIVTGLLASRIDPANNYWNLDTGDLSLSGTFHIKGGEVRITTADDSTNYIKLTGTSNYNHKLQSTQSAGQFTVQNLTLDGYSTLQGHCFQSQFDRDTIFLGVDPATSDNPRLYITDSDGFTYHIGGGEIYINNGTNVFRLSNKHKQISALIDGTTYKMGDNEVYIGNSDGSAAMQPGRFVCSDANGNVKFDSNNF